MEIDAHPRPLEKVRGAAVRAGGAVGNVYATPTIGTIQLGPVTARLMRARARLLRLGLPFLLGILLALYIAGSAASNIIPFGPPLSLGTVLGRLSAADAARETFRLGSTAAVAAVAILAAVANDRLTIRWQRVATCGAALTLPLFLLDPSRAFPQWVFSTLAAPVFTVMAMVGTTDGEFYSEGLLALTAVGWWNLLWIARLIYVAREFRTRATDQSGSATADKPSVSS